MSFFFSFPFREETLTQLVCLCVVDNVLSSRLEHILLDPTMPFHSFNVIPIPTALFVITCLNAAHCLHQALVYCSKKLFLCLRHHRVLFPQRVSFEIGVQLDKCKHEVSPTITCTIFVDIAANAP